MGEVKPHNGRNVQDKSMRMEQNVIIDISIKGANLGIKNYAEICKNW